MSGNPRRKARVAAMQALYEADTSHHEALGVAGPPRRKRST